MLAKLTKRRTQQGGFAMLDVMLGMAIFALLVVIGAQSTSVVRAQADLKSVAGDAQVLAAGLESYLTENETFPLPATGAAVTPNVTYAGAAGAYPRTVSSSSPTDMRGLGVKLEPGHRVTRYWVDDASDGDPVASRAHQFCIVHTSGVWVAWRSSDDMIFAHSKTPASGVWNRVSNPCAP